MFKRERNKGQSTLEYVIIITAVVGAILVGAAIVANKAEDKGLGKLLKSATDKIEGAAGDIGNIGKTN